MKNGIIFVINSLQRGGAERVVSTLAASFYDRKLPVNIVCLNYAETVYTLPQGLKVFCLTRRRGDGVFSRLYNAALIFFKLTRLLLNVKPACVISFMTTANLWTGLTCYLTKTDYIVSERTTPDHTINTYRGFLKWFSRFIYKNAKAVVIPSKGIENCLKKNSSFSDLDNYKVINNPVKTAGNYSPQKVNDRKFILGVGRLSYEKGFDQLIEAYQRSEAVNTDLLIAGDGAEFDSLKKQITALNLQNSVKLLGLKENLHDYYSQAEVFVLPSRNEGYPNALIEAMSVGCSCIAMNCEFGPSEIIKDQSNGLLIEDKNVEQLSAAISRILKDPLLKQKLAHNARLINNTNSLEAISDQWEDLIFSV